MKKPVGRLKIDPNHPIGKHCVFALPFSEGQGTVVTSTSNTNNIRMLGRFMTNNTSKPVWKNQGNGPYLHFGWTEEAWIDFIGSTNFGPLINKRTNFTVRARIRCDGDITDEGQNILSFWNSDPANGEWMLLRRADSFFTGCYSFYYKDTSNSEQALNGHFGTYNAANTWYDFVVVIDFGASPGRFGTFMDGVLDVDGWKETWETTIYANTGSRLTASHNPNYAGWWNGDIDFIEVFDRPLTMAEIKYLNSHLYEEFIPDTQAPSSGGKVWVWTYPNADVTSGLWLPITSGASLYSMIDETVLNDADYIFSSTTPINDTCEVRLSGLSDPVMSTDHVVVYRYWNEGGGSCSLTVSLYQGASLIAEQQHASVGTDPITSSFTLTSGQTDAITDYTDLRLRFKANA